MEELVHKSVYIEPEVWLRLKVNAELSDLTLRDFLRHIILASEPIEPSVGADGAATVVTQPNEG